MPTYETQWVANYWKKILNVQKYYKLEHYLHAGNISDYTLPGIHNMASPMLLLANYTNKYVTLASLQLFMTSKPDQPINQPHSELIIKAEVLQHRGSKLLFGHLPKIKKEQQKTLMCRW